MLCECNGGGGGRTEQIEVLNGRGGPGVHPQSYFGALFVNKISLYFFPEVVRSSWQLC